MSWFHWWYIPLFITIWTVVGFINDLRKSDIWNWIATMLVAGPAIIILLIIWFLSWGVAQLVS